MIMYGYGDSTPIMEKNMVRGNAHWYYVGLVETIAKGSILEFRVTLNLKLSLQHSLISHGEDNVKQRGGLYTSTIIKCRKNLLVVSREEANEIPIHSPYSTFPYSLLTHSKKSFGGPGSHQL